MSMKTSKPHASDGLARDRRDVRSLLPKNTERFVWSMNVGFEGIGGHKQRRETSDSGGPTSWLSRTTAARF